METADITVEFTCADEEMVRERIEDVHLERHRIAHEILSVTPGGIPEGNDECDQPEYRRVHGLQEAPGDPHWSRYVPEGCTRYVARVRLWDPQGIPVTRERIIAIPFGDRDLGFSIDRIGRTD